MLDGMSHIVAATASGIGKQSIEDALIDSVVKQNLPVYQQTLGKIEKADWYILSARKAHLLLKEKMFERCFALVVKSFAKNYSNAELDMHFSLSQDLVPLTEFLRVMRESGLHKVTVMLERGDY